MNRTADDRELVRIEGLARFLEEKLPEFAGPFRVQRIGEGASCLTFLVDGGGWKIVLRRPPRGDLPPTAYDIRREFRVLHALCDAAAPVPVPATLAVCEDASVIGAPFYLMSYVQGVVLRDQIPSVLSGRHDRQRMSEQLLDTLVALHHLDYRMLGLEDFGRPHGYPQRQLRRMRQLWELARFRDLPAVEELGAWLERNVPDQAATVLIHGDWKLDNVMFAPESPARLVAVTDWEMSTLGDPLADLGWLLYFWREPGDPPTELPIATVTERAGFLRRRELLERYVHQTGVSEDNVTWYMVFAGWKISIIMEGSYRRYLAGVGDHPVFAKLDREVPALLRRTSEAMNRRLGV